MGNNCAPFVADLFLYTDQPKKKVFFRVSPRNTTCAIFFFFFFAEKNKKHLSEISRKNSAKFCDKYLRT